MLCGNAYCNTLQTAEREEFTESLNACLTLGWEIKFLGCFLTEKKAFDGSIGIVKSIEFDLSEYI